jgi:hypothetical protein
MRTTPAFCDDDDDDDEDALFEWLTEDKDTLRMSSTVSLRDKLTSRATPLTRSNRSPSTTFPVFSAGRTAFVPGVRLKEVARITVRPPLSPLFLL